MNLQKVIQIKRYVAPCTCAAYAFPHRANGGSCTNPGDEPDTCNDCPHYDYRFDDCGNGFCPWNKQ